MFGSDRESEKEGSVLGRETAAEAGPDQGPSSPSSSGPPHLIQMVALFPRHATQKPVNHPFIAVGCVSAGKHLVPRIRGNQSEVVDLTPHLSMLLSHQSPIGADPAGSDDYSAPIGPDDISQTRAGGPVQPVLKVLFKIQHGKRKKAL